VIVGIDAREAAGPRTGQRAGAAGRSRYVREIVSRLPALAPDLRFLLYTAEPGDVELPENARWRTVGGPGPAWHARAAHAARRECALYFSTSTYVTPQLLPRYVQTVFDTIAFRKAARPQIRAAWIERATMRRAIRRAARIVAISARTAADLEALVPESRGKVDVTPLAADERFHAARPAAELAAVRMRYGLPPDFVLATGTIEPRKNLELLVRAYGDLPTDVRAATPLVLAGRRGWESDAVFDAIATLPPDSVRHLDFVPDEDLPALYSAATLFCYPSLYEGFGLPVLEAMQSGTPVVTSNVSSLPEVGGDAVRYVDPHDRAALAGTLAELLSDSAARATLARAGLDRARAFSWDDTAAKTLDAIRRAA
jgi:glycosyltransferase involved in cell wall biosynthesis